mgnify:CR=1 FL=1
MAKAEEILRVKLGNKATKAASRIAAEGVVAISIDADGKTGAIVEVNCETDFVAKNDDFIRFAKDLAALVVARNPADVAALSAMPLGDGTVESTRTALVGKIGENINVRRFARLQAKGALANYVHGGAKIGVLLDFTGGNAELGRDIAMHIAASKPKALDATGVIVWMPDGPQGSLRPVLAHGYASLALSRMGIIHPAADNATATAYRTKTAVVVPSEVLASGAVVVPLIGSEGCSGAMAVELREGVERAKRRAGVREHARQPVDRRTCA